MKSVLFKLLGAGLFLFAEISASPFCGSSQIWNRISDAKDGRAAARSLGFATTDCEAESYYDSAKVQEKTTEHFRIYYILEGPHKTSAAWIDTLARALEKSWNFHIQKHGTQKPLGANPTWHFQKTGDEALYPVEVLDISLMRDNAELLGGFCTACMGVTFPPDNSNPSVTEIIIDNDFLYPDETSPVAQASPECSFVKSSVPVQNSYTKRNYAEDDFALALYTTAYHEFYHAVQASYVNMLLYDSYWFEASATALEEIASPTANDYWISLATFFSSTGIPFYAMPSDYGIAVFGLYSLNAFNEKFDTRLWERFSATPDSAFETIYAKELESRKLDPDSAFDDFARRLLFAGTRAESADTAVRFTADFSDWPFSPRIQKATTDKLSLQAPAISYRRLTTDSIPNLSNFRGKASVALYGKQQKAVFLSMDTLSWTGILPQIAEADSAVLILSRLRENVQKANAEDTLPMRSYPNPWRSETPLCFANLPEKKNFIEIRTRAGKLVRRHPYTGTSLCIDADELSGKLAPGLYYFRAGNRNKMNPFLVIY